MRALSVGVFVIGLLAGPVAAQRSDRDIRQVSNAADFSDAWSTGVPRGSLFSLTGTGLALSKAASAALPLPVELGGARVEFQDLEGRFLAAAPLLYVSPEQINAVVPTVLAAGTHYVRVLVGGAATEARPIRITGGRFTPLTSSQRGFGPAVAQRSEADGTPQLIRFTAPARAGDLVTLWGTGLGPVSSETDPAVRVFVDGVAVRPDYVGRAPGLTGVDQINFRLPAALRGDCFLPVQIATGTAISGVVTLSAAAESGPCANRLGLSPERLADLDAGRTVRGMVLSFRSVTVSDGGSIQQSAKGWHAEYDAASLSALMTAGFTARATGCMREPDPAERAVYGLRLLSSGPLPTITGRSGCLWSFGTSDNIMTGSGRPDCVAASYRYGPPPAPVPLTEALFIASGAVPEPRQANGISAFSSSKAGQQLAFSWNASAGSTDRISISAGSCFEMRGMFFGTGQRTTNQVVCSVNPADNRFALTEAETNWALGLPNRLPATLTLESSTDETVAMHSPLIDFVLVRMTNAVSASTPVQ